MARKMLASLGFLGFAAGCAGTPDGISEANIADYMAAVESIGCQMRYDSDYVPVEFQTGMTRQQVLDITTYMLARDQAVRLPDGGVKITTGACA
jgi:hypothetical protein